MVALIGHDRSFYTIEIGNCYKSSFPSSPSSIGEQIYNSEYILDVYTSEYILEVSNQKFEFLWIMQVTIKFRGKYITFTYTPNRCLINKSKGH